MRRTQHIVVLLFALLLLCSAAPATDVVIVLSADLPPYIEAAEGVKEALAAQGVEAVEVSLAGKQEKWAGVAQQIERESPRVVVPLGSLATALTARRMSGDAALVYSMILNPEALLGSAPAERRVTGVSMNLDPADVFGHIREALPRARKVGVLYDPARSAGIVDEARVAAAGSGIQLVAREVANPRDLPDALLSLCDERVDALWLFVDRTVLRTREGLELIMVETLRRGIPIVAPSDRYVKSGALLGVSAEYQDLGRQTGELVLETLRSDPITPGPQRPRDLTLSLNEKVREAMDVSLPAMFLQEVDRYVK